MYSFTGLNIVKTHLPQKLIINKTSILISIIIFSRIKSKTNNVKHFQRKRKNTKEQFFQKQRTNRKLEEKILTEKTKEKSKQHKSSRLRSQPRKNYETFIPQSKIKKKVKIQ